jgi:hypothetical protein
MLVATARNNYARIPGRHLSCNLGAVVCAVHIGIVADADPKTTRLRSIAASTRRISTRFKSA